MKKQTKAAARRERLAKRNARQRAYRALPGRAAAEALASRKTYWRNRGARVWAFETSAQCQCLFCRRAYAALAAPYRGASC
jgi:hypothetical protein